MTEPMGAVASTLAMVRAAEAAGVDARSVLARHGVAMETLLNTDNQIPIARAFAIWDELRDRSGNPALHLVAPTALPVGTYHVVEYLIGASATVGEGAQRFARFIGLIARQVSVVVETDPVEGRLVATTSSGLAVPPLYAAYTFAAFVGRVRANFRPGLRVARVEFRQPIPSEPERYRAFFGADVFFGAAADRLCFSRDEWDTPFETGDPTLAQVLEAHARARLERAADGTSVLEARVRRAIVGALPEGAPVEAVARSLHSSVRTLQRGLREAGTTYRDLLDTVRSELARQFLEDRTVAISEVALLLGFADQSSFHRAFDRWTGQSPGRWRTAALAPPVAPAPPLEP